VFLQCGTVLGEPNRVVNLGETFIPYQVFLDYVLGLGESTFRLVKCLLILPSQLLGYILLRSLHLDLDALIINIRFDFAAFCNPLFSLGPKLF
jgi:hypothetical protein